MNLRHAHAVFVHGDSVVHRLPAVVKLVALLTVVVAVVATPRERAWALVSEAALVIVAATAARLRPSILVRRAVLAAPFLAAAAILPVVGGGPRVSILGVDVSVEGLWAGWAIAAKGLTCVAATVVVTATTPVPDMLSGLSRLRVPSLFVSIAAFMVRYVDVLADEAARLRTAMAARGHAPRWLWQAAPTARAASALFVRSYERGERTYDAMMARGYTGDMPRMGSAEVSGRDWRRGLALPGAVVALATAALLSSGGPT